MGTRPGGTWPMISSGRLDGDLVRSNLAEGVDALDDELLEREGVLAGPPGLSDILVVEGD